MSHDFAADIAAVNGIAAVPTILDVICRTTGMGFAAIARVTEERWITCRTLDTINFGLKPGDELKVETTLCHEVRQMAEPIVIDNVAEDEKYCGHHTPAIYGLQSYISVPIVLPDGTFFGTLCAIDARPAKLKTPEIMGMFRAFAELIGFHLANSEQYASNAARLRQERENSELLEQFIAVLGHDLRNPLASIDAGVKLLQRMPTLDDRGRNITGLMQNTVVRMNGLVENLMDLARGRLGSGIALVRTPKPLAETIGQVVAEMQAVWPDRDIRTAFDLPGAFTADHGRLAQLVSNLLANALTHGDPNAPVTVEATQDAAGLVLSITNTGDPIPPVALERLFQPFYRGQVRPGLEGLGLGLFIASEIARAHGGRLDVSSSADETRFTLTIPPAA